MSKILFSVPVVLLVSALQAERQPFERYETILDRQMFGPPPPGFDPTKMPSEVSASNSRGKASELSKEQEQLKSAIRFSAINAKADGTVFVGFTDNSNAKQPRHHYLKVGETSEDGWMVKEADAVKETMTVEKEGVEVSLSLGGSSGGAAGGSPNGAQGGGRSADPRSGRTGLLSGGGSLMQRRHQRREEERKAEEARREEERKAREDDRRKAEEESAQRALEREEQRKQLLQIQEELRRTREERAAQEARNAAAAEGDEQ